MGLIELFALNLYTIAGGCFHIILYIVTAGYVRTHM